jgi:(2Fe-2S) ferredoxin
VDRAQPALPEALDLCADADQILILPVMVPDEPSLRRWLHKLIMRWRAKHRLRATGTRPRIVFAQPLLQLPALAELLAATIPSALQQPDVPQLLADEDWERDPKAWSQVPEHQHHVLWCVGPAARPGSRRAVAATGTHRAAKPAAQKQVMLLQTSCQYPCNHGPLMIVYPDGVWYGPMDATTVEPVLTAHVLHDCASTPRVHVHGPHCSNAPDFPVDPHPE